MKTITLHALRDTECSTRKYLFRAWAIAFLPAILVGFVVTSLFGTIHERILRQNPVGTVLSMVLFAPLFETLFMWLGISIIRRFTRNLKSIAVVSAAVWAVLHSLAWPPSGLIVFWPFLVFSIVFLTWEPTSRWKAFWMTAGVHAAYNTVPALLVCVAS